MYKGLQVFALLFAAPAFLSAQSTFGTILGTVSDSSGAVVPGATIVITNESENTARSLVSDDQGNYEALNLKAGVYSISAERPGFKSFRAAHLDLAARQTLRVNVTLDVGAVAETVDVNALAPVITTDTQAIAATFSTQQVLHLPVNYRGAGSTSPLRILAFQTGVQADNGTGFSVQGGIPAQTRSRSMASLRRTPPTTTRSASSSHLPKASPR